MFKTGIAGSSLQINKISCVTFKHLTLFFLVHVVLLFKKVYIHRIFYFKYSIFFTLNIKNCLPKTSVLTSLTTESSNTLLNCSYIWSLRCVSLLEDFIFRDKCFVWNIYHLCILWNTLNYSFVKCHFSAKVNLYLFRKETTIITKTPQMCFFWWTELFRKFFHVANLFFFFFFYVIGIKLQILEIFFHCKAPRIFA